MSDEPVRRPEDDATTQPQPQPGAGESPTGEGLTPEAAASAEAAQPPRPPRWRLTASADATASAVSPEADRVARGHRGGRGRRSTAEACADDGRGRRDDRAASTRNPTTETGSRRRVVGGVLDGGHGPHRARAARRWHRAGQLHLPVDPSPSDGRQASPAPSSGSTSSRPGVHLRPGDQRRGCRALVARPRSTPRPDP